MFKRFKSTDASFSIVDPIAGSSIRVLHFRVNANGAADGEFCTSTGDVGISGIIYSPGIGGGASGAHHERH